VHNDKARAIDLSAMLEPGFALRPGAATRRVRSQDHGLSKALDLRLIEACRPALDSQAKVDLEFPIENLNRSVGTMLSCRISKKYGEAGLPDGTINIHLHGTAGQSFGAFLTKGVSMVLDGEANDYCCKGLSGGKVVVRPPPGSSFDSSQNVICGNVACYGATSGTMYIRGKAAERFAVRNSGALAIVEGVGDHALEYMTGGTAIILGETGRNVAAGMSGGTAYVLDVDGSFASKCNMEMIELEDVSDPSDEALLKNHIQDFAEETGSPVAHGLLADWAAAKTKFVKVMPIDLKRVLMERAELKIEVAAKQQMSA